MDKEGKTAKGEEKLMDEKKLKGDWEKRRWRRCQKSRRYRVKA